jgi:hypothetical protein
LALKLEEGITVALPTRVGYNIRVLSVASDGSFSAHHKNNYNLNGDFRTELMMFSNDLVLDTEDKKKRNEQRLANGLLGIK